MSWQLSKILELLTGGAPATVQADVAAIKGHVDGLETKLDSLIADSAKLDRKVASGVIMSATADNDPYVAFGSQACGALEVVNDSGKTLYVKRGGAGTAFVMPTGTSKVFAGLANANEISVANGTDATEITVYAEAITFA